MFVIACLHTVFYSEHAAMFMINFRDKWLTRYRHEIGIKGNFHVVAMLFF